MNKIGQVNKKNMKFLILLLDLGITELEIV